MALAPRLRSVLAHRHCAIPGHSEPAAEGLFGQAGMPLFDIGNADVVLAFGADFLGASISQVSSNLAYARMRKANPQVRGYLIQFEPRMSQTASKADEWVPILPGTEAQVALAIGRFVAEAKGGTVPKMFAAVDLEKVSKASGVPMATLSRIAQTVVQAAKPIAVPGNAALGMSNGLAVAQAVLALNAMAGNFGQPGGVSLSPLAPLEDSYHRPASAKEMSDFIGLLNSGKVKTLLIHRVNPLFELPKPLSFEAALAKVGTVAFHLRRIRMKRPSQLTTSCLIIQALRRVGIPAGSDRHDTVRTFRHAARCHPVLMKEQDRQAMY